MMWIYPFEEAGLDFNISNSFFFLANYEIYSSEFWSLKFG